MSAYMRPSLKVASLTAAGVGVGYVGYRYYTTTSIFFTQAHAEAPISKKVSWSGFTELKLESAEMVNHNVRRLTFALPESDSITGIAPITSMLTRHTPEGAWIPVIRPYTPVSDNDSPGYVTFMVKKYPNGKGSGKMHSLQPGETMKFKPLEEFVYKENEYSAMTFIAGGSGITPIYQLTRAILKNPNDKTKITLLYANNTEDDILLKEEFDELEKRFPDRFQKKYTVSQSTPGNAGKYETGYIDKAMLQKVMPSKINERNVKVLVSGPPAMIASIAGAKGGFGWTQGNLGGILSELGYTKDEVHKF